MMKGDMCLKMIEQGKHKDVVIREGEAFLLPPKIAHSPQRQPNTIGLVIERERLIHELDGLRWYVGDSAEEVLYERFFYCKNLGQLKPIIEEFFQSEEYKSGKPGSKSFMGSAPYEADNKTKVMKPINVSDWLEKQQFNDKTGFIDLFVDQKPESSVRFYGPGLHVIETTNDTETFLWQWKDSATTQSSDGDDSFLQTLPSNSCLFLPKNSRLCLQNHVGVTLSVSMPVSLFQHRFRHKEPNREPNSLL